MSHENPSTIVACMATNCNTMTLYYIHVAVMPVFCIPNVVVLYM